MTRWIYSNGRRRFLLSAETSSQIDAEWRRVWQASDAIFSAARKEVEEGTPTSESIMKQFWNCARRVFR